MTGPARFDGDTYQLPDVVEAQVYAAAEHLDEQRGHFSGILEMTASQRVLGVPFAGSSAEALLILAEAMDRASLTYANLSAEIRRSCGQRES